MVADGENQIPLILILDQTAYITNIDHFLENKVMLKSVNNKII